MVVTADQVQQARADSTCTCHLARREAMSHMRPIPRERQASCQTEQCLLDALKPATAEALVQTNPVPQLALGLELGAGLEGAGGLRGWLG